MQKEAQLISEGVYLGPLTIAKDYEALSKLGITNVLSILGPDQDFEKVAVSEENRLWI